MALREAGGIKNVYLKTGVGGADTATWAPSSSNYATAVKASNASSYASALHAAHPDAGMVFSIMLGTNDSAVSPPVSNATTAPT